MAALEVVAAEPPSLARRVRRMLERNTEDRNGYRCCVEEISDRKIAARFPDVARDRSSAGMIRGVKKEFHCIRTVGRKRAIGANDEVYLDPVATLCSDERREQGFEPSVPHKDDRSGTPNLDRSR